jgi:hypothetical protein
MDIMNRQAVKAFATGALAGAAAAFLLDPRSGRRRRAVTRDKAGKYRRLSARWFTGGWRAAAGPLRGAAHEAARHAPGYEPAPPPDTNAFIKQRVESELGRFPELPLAGLVFDAADGVVNVRGVVQDDDCAEAILQRVAAVEGVRAAISYMRTEDGTPAGTYAGEVEAIATMPAVLKTNALRGQLFARWPSLTDDDILASGGHIAPLAEAISRRTGEPESGVRAALDELLLAAT